VSLTRTNVYPDPDDLAMIKEIAARRGVPEAESGCCPTLSSLTLA
jgi:hypothetical protein